MWFPPALPSPPRPQRNSPLIGTPPRQQAYDPLASLRQQGRATADAALVLAASAHVVHSVALLGSGLAGEEAHVQA